jgi:hypothetical protein
MVGKGAVSPVVLMMILPFDTHVHFNKESGLGSRKFPFALLGLYVDDSARAWKLNVVMAGE